MDLRERKHRQICIYFRRLTCSPSIVRHLKAIALAAIPGCFIWLIPACWAYFAYCGAICCSILSSITIRADGCPILARRFARWADNAWMYLLLLGLHIRKLSTNVSRTQPNFQKLEQSRSFGSSNKRLYKLCSSSNHAFQNERTLPKLYTMKSALLRQHLRRRSMTSSLVLEQVKYSSQ